MTLREPVSAPYAAASAREAPATRRESRPAWRCRGGVGEIQGRYRADTGEIQGRYSGGIGEIEGR